MIKNSEDDLLAVAKLLLYEPNERDPAFTQRAMKMLKLLFMAARKAGEPPFSFVRKVSLMGINTLAKTIHSVDEELAGRLVDGDYHPNKDYRDNNPTTLTLGIFSAKIERVNFTSA